MIKMTVTVLGYVALMLAAICENVQHRPYRATHDGEVKEVTCASMRSLPRSADHSLAFEE